MTELDAEIGPLALELIDEFGKSINFISVVAGNYDPTTGEAMPNSTNKAIKAIVEDYKGQDYSSDLIEGGDKKVTVAAQAFNSIPTTSDKVEIDGLSYTIQAVKVIYSGDLAAIYELQARI